jgi:hypothetical protein
MRNSINRNYGLVCSTSLYSEAIFMPTLIVGAILPILNAVGISGLGVALLGEGGFVEALGGAVSLGLSAAASIGLSLALREKPPTPQPSDVQSNIRQEIGPRRRVYYRQLMGSIIIFGFRRGQKSYILHYICEGPIEGYVSFRLDKKPVTLDEDGFVTDTQYIVKGRSRVQILTTLGTMTDEPFAEILAAFPELDNPLKPFRQRGCAMVLQIVEQVPADKLQDVYPNNMPSLQVVIDGLNNIYDPRDESTGLSGNAGLCLLAETADVYGLDPDDGEEIDVASFAAFANICDEDVALKAGGTEKRYRCAGPIMMNAENEDRIKAIAAICNAEVYIDPQGRIAVREKLRSTPGIALRAKNGDHLGLSLEGGRPLQKRFNTAKATYVDPDLNYKANEVRWQHSGFFEDDGEEFSVPVPANLCPSSTQAQRLAKLAVYESNPDFVGQLTSGPQALDLVEDYVFTIDLSPEDTFERVASATGAVEYNPEQMTVSSGFAVFATGATDWTPATDEQDQVEIPPTLPSNVDEVTLDVTVTVGVLENSAPVLNFSWVGAGSADLPDSYSQQVQVSPADADEWHDAVVNQEDSTAQYGPVADGGAYDWRIRNIASGKTFDWQESTVPVTVVVNPSAPVSLAVFTVTGDQLAHTDIAIATANDANLASVYICRAPAGTSFDGSSQADIDTYKVAQLAAAPGTSFSYIDGDATRVNLFANYDFATTASWTLQTGWAISGGTANATAGSLSYIYQSPITTAIATYRFRFDVSGGTTGNIRPVITGVALAGGTSRTGTGTFFGTVVNGNAGNTLVGFEKTSTFNRSLDNAYCYRETAACAPQGSFDYYAIPCNISGVLGPASGPLTRTII